MLLSTVVVVELDVEVSTDDDVDPTLVVNDVVLVVAVAVAVSAATAAATTGMDVLVVSVGGGLRSAKSDGHAASSVVGGAMPDTALKNENKESSMGLGLVVVAVTVVVPVIVVVEAAVAVTVVSVAETESVVVTRVGTPIVRRGLVVLANSPGSLVVPVLLLVDDVAVTLVPPVVSSDDVDAAAAAAAAAAASALLRALALSEIGNAVGRKARAHISTPVPTVATVHELVGGISEMIRNDEAVATGKGVDKREVKIRSNRKSCGPRPNMSTPNDTNIFG